MFLGPACIEGGRDPEHKVLFTLKMAPTPEIICLDLREHFRHPGLLLLERHPRLRGPLVLLLHMLGHRADHVADLLRHECVELANTYKKRGAPGYDLMTAATMELRTTQSQPVNRQMWTYSPYGAILTVLTMFTNPSSWLLTSLLFSSAFTNTSFKLKVALDVT